MHKLYEKCVECNLRAKNEVSLRIQKRFFSAYETVLVAIKRAYLPVNRQKSFSLAIERLVSVV